MVVIKEKIVYPTDVPRLHGFCTFSVPHLKIVVPHLKLEQLATLVAHEFEFEVQLRKSENLPFLPKITWVPDQSEFESEWKKFRTFPFIPTIT